MIYIKQKENYENYGYDHKGSEVREETIIELLYYFIYINIYICYIIINKVQKGKIKIRFTA